MKKILFVTAVLAIGVAVSSCKDCDGENPRARILNNGSSSVSVQIKTSGGNTENINNIAAGAASDYSSYASGTVVFTISVGKTDYVQQVEMAECYEYDIAIDKNNNIVSTPKDRNE